MEHMVEVVNRYFAIWNETDAARRRELIARTWKEDASYLDPLMQGDGHAGIDALVQGVQAQFPGYRFRQTGAVDAHHDHIRFWGELAPANGPAAVAGTDFGVVAVDGRLQTIVGFLDSAVAAGPEQ